jgi:hypothetical protein
LAVKDERARNRENFYDASRLSSKQRRRRESAQGRMETKAREKERGLIGLEEDGRRFD